MITKNNSFANYLFDIASEKKRVSDYLKYAKTLITILNNTEEIISAMSNKAIEKKQRKMMTFEIFDKILPPDFIYLLWSLIDFDHTREIKSIFKDFIDICNEKLKLDKVRVYTARKLNNSELENLRQALVKITKKDIEIIKVVDRSLIGGIKIEGDAYTIDDTIKYKIENFYKENFNVKIK